MIAQLLTFSPFHLDVPDASLWRGRKKVPLPPKEFALLHHLVTHAGQLVTTDTLFTTGWPGVTVSSGVLKVRMSQVRHALGDDAEKPRFIETVHGRGYRFIAEVVSKQALGAKSASSSTSVEVRTDTWQLTTPLVGREPEFASLVTAFSEAQAGRGRAIFLAGESGIGKTRMASELTRYAQQRGARVFIGRCYETQGAPPFWPWAQMVKTYTLTLSTTALKAQLGTSLRDVLQIIPDVRQRATKPSTIPLLESAQARFRFFESFVTFLHTAASTQPLVLVLEDLHWADTPSLLLLQFLAHELPRLPIVLIGTYRTPALPPEHPLTQALGEIARTPASQTLGLRGINEQAVARLIELTAGHAPSATMTAAILQRTAGNPFFVTELVRTLHENGQLTHQEHAPAPPLPLPPRVREAIARRLETLSSSCRHLLTLGSVIGHEFTTALLSKVHLREKTQSRVEESFLSVLSEAVAAHFLVSEPGGAGRYSFSHALVRETLYEALDDARRAHLHRVVGGVLEQQTRPVPDHLVAEIALHFFHAVPAGNDNKKALTYAVRAAEHAASRFAYEDAISHYSRALAVMESRGESSDKQCELLLALGEQQRKAGQVAAAKTTFRRVAEFARTLHGQGKKQQGTMFLARAALGFAPGLAGVGVNSGSHDASVIELLQEALLAFGKKVSPLRARMLGRLAMELYWTSAVDQREPLCREAVALARKLGDPAVLAETLYAQHAALRSPSNADERLVLTNEIITLAEKIGDKEQALRGRLWRIVDLAELGEVSVADREFETFRQQAEALRQPAYLWFLSVWRATRAWTRGHFDSADQFARDALSIGQRTQNPDATLCFMVQTFGLSVGRGLNHMSVPVQQLSEEYVALSAWRSTLVLVYALAGAKAEAQQELDRLAARDFADLPQDADWLISLANVGLGCSVLRDVPRAARVYQLLLPHAHRGIVVGPGLIFLGGVSRILGMLAITQGLDTEAEGHFLEALAHNTRLGFLPIIVLTQQQFASMLLIRRWPGDAQRALRLLEHALQTARALDMEETLLRTQELYERAQYLLSSHGEEGHAENPSLTGIIGKDQTRPRRETRVMKS
ncbi:MAG: AAA family ATPase [Deltaproteobacteria bacterium]|nr:AAA family ATPase [Deltaproteobacteria bacterium]